MVRHHDLRVLKHIGSILPSPEGGADWQEQPKVGLAFARMTDNGPVYAMRAKSGKEKVRQPFGCHHPNVNDGESSLLDHWSPVAAVVCAQCCNKLLPTRKNATRESTCK